MRDRDYQAQGLLKKKSEILERYRALVAGSLSLRGENAQCFWAGNGILSGVAGRLSSKNPDNWTDFVRNINALDRLENERRALLEEARRLDVRLD